MMLARRGTAVAAGALGIVAMFIALATPARAAGAGGVELTPIVAADAPPSKRSAFHVDLKGSKRTTQQFDLRNLSNSPVTAKLYSAAAARQPQGGFAVSGAGSAPWIELPMSSVRLQAHEVRRITFTITEPDAVVDQHSYGAVVMQPGEGSSVVVRVATIVYLTQDTPTEDGGSPLFAGVAASVAILVVGGAIALVMVRRGRSGRRVPLDRSVVEDVWRHEEAGNARRDLG